MASLSQLYGKEGVSWSKPAGLAEFRLLHWNTQSVKTKAASLASYLIDHKIDCICVNEANPQNDATSLSGIPGYKMVSYSCRHENSNIRIKKGGGTAIFVKPGFPAIPIKRNVLNDKSFGPLEVSGIWIDLSNPENQGGHSTTPPHQQKS